MSPRVSRAESKSQTPSQQTTLLGSIPLPSCSSIHGNLTWSALGQALVVTDDILFVLSPLAGLHPKLATPSRLCDVESHPDWQGSFPHASYQIHIKTLLEEDTTERQRHTLESDYSDGHPLFTNARWKSATWSRSGMGPNGSCLILAVTSEMDLYIIGAPSNSWTGDWKLLHSVSFGQVEVPVTFNGHQHDNDPAASDPDMRMFTPSRTTVRKQQKATEVLSASWVHSLSQARNVGTDQVTKVSSTWIVAGLRAGCVVVLNCQAVSGHCTLSSTVPLSEWGLDRLLANASEESGKLAFQCAEGTFLCPLGVDESYCNVHTPSRPLSVQHQSPSAWAWLQNRFVIATVGRVHVYDSLNSISRTYFLGTAPGLVSDPYAAAVSIHQDGRADGCVVVLQDLFQYFVPFTFRPASKDEHVLAPSALPPARGYPPLTEPLQRQYDSRQKYHAFEPQSCPTSHPEHTHLVGATLMDERAASFGFNVSETSKYQLLLRQQELGQSISSLLSDTLRAVVSGIRHHQPPVAALGPIMAVVHTSADVDAMAKTLAQHMLEIGNTVSMQREPFDTVTTPNDDTILAQEQALYVLSIWLLRQPKAGIASNDLQPAQHRQRVTTSFLVQWLPDLAKRCSQQRSEADRRTLLRLTAAAHLLPDSSLGSGIQEARSAALAAIGEEAERWGDTTSDGFKGIDTQESCAACSSPLSLTWSEDSHSFEYAECKNLHIWPRCSVTMAAISDLEVRACTTCWAKSLLPGAIGQSPSERAMLQAATRCSYCGSCWIVT